MNHTPPLVRRIAAIALALFSAGCVTTVAAPSATAALSAQPPAAPADLIKSVPSPFVPKAAQAPNSYVGKLAGNPSGLAAIVSGTKVLFYWCDGKAPGDWFGGTNANGTISGESAKGIAIKAKLASGKISGSLSRGGKPFTFTLSPANKGTGLFRTTEIPGGKPGAVLGWIALDNALVGATNEADGTVSDAVPMSLSTFGGGCFRVRRAIKVMVNAGASADTVLGMKIDGQFAGCKTQDLGISAT